MVRMVYCVMRKEGVSVKAFREYFTSQHRDRICTTARQLKAKRFSQSLALIVDEGFQLMARHDTVLPYDGVNEIWWDSARDFHQQVEPESIEKLLDQLFAGDEEYIDLRRSALFFTEQPQDCPKKDLL